MTRTPIAYCITDYIRSRFGPNQLKDFSFFKPAEDDGSLKVWKEAGGENVVEGRPIVVLTLPRKTAVPLHKHFKKKKWYICLTGSVTVVVLDENGKETMTDLNPLSPPLRIDVGGVHTVLSHEGGTLLVSPTTADGKDIQWQEGHEKLVE